MESGQCSVAEQILCTQQILGVDPSVFRSGLDGSVTEAQFSAVSYDHIPAVFVS